MSVEFDFSQVDKLAVDLGRSGVTIVAKTESEVLTETANEVKAAAVAAAPRLTGDLAGSIRVQGGKGWRKVGSPLKQGFFQEFGTSRHPPQPWLYPQVGMAYVELAWRLKEIADPLNP